MFFQSSLGIHVEKNAVSIALVKMSFRGVRPAASEIRPLDGGMSLKERVKKVAEIVNDFFREHRVSPTSVFLSIPRELVLVRNVSLPLAVKANLKGTLGYEMNKYAPFEADNVYFDHQVLREDKSANVLDLILYVARREDVDAYYALKDFIGKGISGMEIGSTALVNALSHIDSNLSVRPLMIVNQEKGCFEVDAVSKGRLSFSRTFTLLDEQSPGPGEIGEGLEQARRFVQWNKDSFGVALFGPAGNKHIFNGLKESGFDVLDFDSSDARIPQGLMPAFGVALKGLVKLPNPVNLLPTEMQKRPGKAGYYLMVALAFTSLLAGVGWWSSEVLHQRLLIERLDKEADGLRSEAVKVEDIRKKCEAVEKELVEIVSFTDGGPFVMDVLKEFTNRVPQDAWLTGLSLIKGKAVISGYADTASQLIPQLEESPLFKNAVFLSTITKTKEGKDRFQIGLDLE